jgi:glucose/mannose-6-phosphate isomerase
VVIASSFSGNTEETLAAYGEAVARECRVVVVCSGGELAARAEADDVPRVPVPSSIPMPRAALGYLAAAPLGILHAIGLLPQAAADVAATAEHLATLAKALGPDVRSADGNQAKDVARWIGTRVPVVWGSEGLAEAPALRWKTQLNENAKVPSWAGVLPELDHNEIEGWAPGAGDGFCLAILRHDGEHPRVSARVAATLEAIRPAGLDAREIRAAGTSDAQRLFSLIMVGDFTATYLGVLHGVDPTPIPTLVSLKERLRG